jgi:hypothetical protein
MEGPNDAPLDPCPARRVDAQHAMRLVVVAGRNAGELGRIDGV